MTKKKKRVKEMNRSLQQKLDNALIEHSRRKGKARKRRSGKGRSI